MQYAKRERLHIDEIMENLNAFLAGKYILHVCECHREKSHT